MKYFVACQNTEYRIDGAALGVAPFLVLVFYNTCIRWLRYERGVMR